MKLETKRKLRVMTEEADVRDFIETIAEGYGWHVSHIESPITSPGIPDLCLSIGDHDLWIEIKVWRRGIHMRPPQRKWHRERAASGGRSFVLCYIDGFIYPITGVMAAMLTPKHKNWKPDVRYGLEDVAELLDWLAARPYARPIHGTAESAVSTDSQPGSLASLTEEPHSD
jgi:hypothetical protein